MLVYDVILPWTQVKKVLALFKKKVHKGFYFDVEPTYGALYRVKVFKE